MTARTDFTDDEWARLLRAPLLVALAVTLADPGGPIEAVKETSAATRVVIEAAESNDGGLVGAVAGEIEAMGKRRENPMGGFHARSIDEILAEAQAVASLLERRAEPADVAAFREFLREAAQAAAKAAKEGGFLGIGGELVSERENEMLDRLGAIFGAPPE